MITHEEASELLGSLALDAVDGEEYLAVTEHIDSCPRCRAELDGLRGGFRSGQHGGTRARRTLVEHRRALARATRRGDPADAAAGVDRR